MPHGFPHDAARFLGALRRNNRKDWFDELKITPPKTSVTRADDHGSIEFALTFVPA